MDANTNPRDVLPVNRWTTKQEVRKQMWEQQSWSTRYDLVTPTEDKLDQSLLFLTRDMGLDDALEPFRIFVSERALALFNQVTWMGKEYVEASNEARIAYEAANGLNGRYQGIVCAVIHLRSATAIAANVAVKKALGECGQTYDIYSDVRSQEGLVLAEKLINVLRSEGLL
jgi:hypothetical protein